MAVAASDASDGDEPSRPRQAKRATVGNDVATLYRSEATKVHPPLPAVVHAELSAGLRLALAELPPAALSTFKHAASMANPKFYELQRLRKSTWDTPRFVRGYDITLDDHLVLPRGLRHTVTSIVERAGSRLAVLDLRNPGIEIDVAFTAELKPDQAAAVGAMLSHDDGVLVAPPGSGKTVMACAIIAERATSTLILVDRKALAEQWRTQVGTLLGMKPGQVGGGRRKLTGVVDIAMLPTLTRHDDVADLTRGYGHVVIDECHHLAAAAYDHSVKRIGAQFWLGLTATPARRDGLGELVTWQLGPIRPTLAKQVPLTATLMAPAGLRRVLHTHETAFRFDTLDVAAPGAVAEAHRVLVADHDRNVQIVDDISEALARGRNCLVLTRRDAHVETLTRMLAERGRDAIVLQGGMSAAARRAAVDRLADAKAGDGVLVVGTTPFIGEGFRRASAGHPVPGRPGFLRRPAHPVRRPGRAHRSRQRHCRGPRLARPRGPDPGRLAATAHARLPHTRLHKGLTWTRIPWPVGCPDGPPQAIAIADLDQLVAAITVDAYGDDEPQTAFVEVFHQEVRLPAAATVLGMPIDVVGFDYHDERLGHRRQVPPRRRPAGSRDS